MGKKEGGGEDGFIFFFLEGRGRVLCVRVFLCCFCVGFVRFCLVLFGFVLVLFGFCVQFLWFLRFIEKTKRRLRGNRTNHT